MTLERIAGGASDAPFPVYAHLADDLVAAHQAVGIAKRYHAVEAPVGERDAVGLAGSELTDQRVLVPGIDHQREVVGRGDVAGVEPGAVHRRAALLAGVEQATLIDNWDVMGLRATGSIDYEIDSVFVPEHFSHFAVTEME